MLLHSTPNQSDINRIFAFACRMHLIVTLVCCGHSSCCSGWTGRKYKEYKNIKNIKYKKYKAIKKDTFYSLHLKQNLYTANVGHKPQSDYMTCSFYTAIVGYLKCQIICSPCMLLCGTWDTSFLRDGENSWKKC